MIAIDSDKRLFYEGSSNYGHGIWPSPVISIATLLAPGKDDAAQIVESPNLGHAKLIFREDAFDPVTRIRRGRFYNNPGNQPQQWYVQTHPAFHEEVGKRDHQGNLVKSLYGFQRWPAFTELNPKKATSLVALGTEEAYTLWTVIGIERIVTGEDLVTLRARSTFGVLPEIHVESIPAIGRDGVLQTMEKVVEAAHRAGPESVIDRCRDAAQVAMGVWMADKFQDDGLRLTELARQAKTLEERSSEGYVITVAVAKAIARLHARCKPNEQLKREGRLPVEGDAESAIAMLGLLYREFRWCPV